MLILSRKQNQKIRLGNDVIINVISISDGSVKIGIEADKNIKIYREEIYQSIKEHTKQAADNIAEALPVNIELFQLNMIANNEKNSKD